MKEEKQTLRDLAHIIDPHKDWVIYSKEEYIDYELTILRSYKKPLRLTFSFPSIFAKIVGKALKRAFGDKIKPYTPLDVKSLDWSNYTNMGCGLWQCSEKIVAEVSETAFYVYVRFYFDGAEIEPQHLKRMIIGAVREAAEGNIVNVNATADDEEDLEVEDGEMLHSLTMLDDEEENDRRLLGIPDITFDEFLMFYPENTRQSLLRIRYMVDVITTEKGKGIHFSALLAGTPGTGKSLFASLTAQYAAQRKALVVVLGGSFWFDYIRDTLRMFPCVLFIMDECEHLIQNREKTHKSKLIELMRLLDGYFRSDIVASWGLIMTTNRPHVIDPAFLRPVRLDELVEFSSIEDEALANKLFRFWCDKLGVELPSDYDPKILKGKTHAECVAVAQKLFRMSKFGYPITADTIKTLFKSISLWSKPEKIKSHLSEGEKIGF